MRHSVPHVLTPMSPTVHELAKSLAACGIVTLWTSLALAVDIERVKWGFDGTVVANRFNLLSIEVSNNSPEAFDGQLQLRKSYYGNSYIDAPLIESVYVAPFTRKWVQFYPYTINDSETWTLAARSKSGVGASFDLKSPKLGQPARVTLVAEDNPFTASGGMQRFPEHIFPPVSTGTDGLAAVVLDHVPRWSAQQQRQAFLDWLWRGGTIHVCHDIDGTFPQFPDTLDVLNSSDQTTRVGSGLVHRHSRKLRDFDRDFIRREILAGSELRKDSGNSKFDSDYKYEEPLVEPDVYFDRLRRMTQPDHNWAAIHLLSILYLLLIFPGCYLLGRQRTDYRVVYPAILLLVLLFGFFFRKIGQRGYGESTAVNSVAIARPLEGDAFDVTQWTNVFVTEGDDYRITHEGIGQLYATAQFHEAVNGAINSGVDGSFDVDIPPYSNRSFTHRVKLQAQPIRLTVETWKAGSTLDKLVLTTDESFPSTSQPIYALYRNQVYVMDRAGDRLTAGYGLQKLTSVLTDDHKTGELDYGFDWDEESLDPEGLYDRMHIPLITASLGVAKQSELSKFTLPRDQIRVFVYAPASDAFFTKDERFGKQAGFVLYCIDVFKPETP